MAIVMGGLRPSTTEEVNDIFRQEIMHHWHDVEDKTGAAFQYSNALPEGFIYDTEPACRAVISIGTLAAEKAFPFFTLIQQSFYQYGIDVSQEDNLASLAHECGIKPEIFLETFRSEQLIKATKQHFEQTQSFEVRGFPTLILQKDKQYHSLCRGYKGYEALSRELDELINYPLHPPS